MLADHGLGQALGIAASEAAMGAHAAQAVLHRFFHNYAVVQELARQFKETTGSLICGELLGLTKPEGSPQAEARTPEYYQKRPCSFMVETAAKLFAEYVENQKQ